MSGGRRFNPQARRLTPEEKIDRVLNRIQQNVNQGRYGGCLKVPQPYELIGKSSSLRAKARDLQDRCDRNAKLYAIANKIWRLARLAVIVIGFTAFIYWIFISIFK
jgi:hypothetical protein